MNKICYWLTGVLLVITQLSNAQVKPVEIYSSTRFWESDKTKTGSGFKFRSTTIVKHPYSFAFYKDHIIIENKEKTFYKINKVESKWEDATHYYVSNLDGQSFLILLSDDIIDKIHCYTITVMKTDKNGKEISVTRFDVKDKIVPK